MAGKNSKVVVDGHPAVVHPVGLCVDTDRRRLYWFDTEYRTISTCKYDGTEVIKYSVASNIQVLNLAVYMVSLRTLV